MRLLLIEVYDKAARKCCPPYEVLFSRSVHPFAFPEALFGPLVWRESRSVVRMFAQTEESSRMRSKPPTYSFYPLADRWPRAAVVRGLMAMQCSTNHDVIYCIIPVVLSSEDML
ncbi:hypothetical protein AcW1_005124 [Taiwanofungus camphoratus]|nr:hypothetical protein AcV5_001490 [Antrodia cinnamomea]KAI0941061.1 hypothetical protein AcV7_002710 [Antrodia cinnamomea]KAI0960662.1 hypothetical protein AcW1_005124 [Antrodia cinnamomea]